MAQRIAMTRAVGMGPLPELLERQESARAVERAFARENLPLCLIEQRDHVVPLQTLVNLFEHAARSSGDRVFGLHVGLEMSPAEYGLLVRYALQAPTLSEAIARIIRFFALHQTGGGMVLARRPNGNVAWEYRHIGMEGATAKHHTDHIVPVMTRIARAYLGPKWTPDQIEVNYSRPCDGGASREEVTGTAWVFGRPCLALVMPGAALSARRHPAGGVGTQTNLVTSQEITAKHRKTQPRGAQAPIAEIVALRLLDGETDADGAARMLGMGRRQMQRVLAMEGTTYRTLLERTRMGRARALIDQTELSLTQVAFDLGYSDPAHFTRAFKRHFGHPPSHARGEG